MANKNTDPIEMLADSICNALVSASTRAGKETAPNDKTFPAIILGTNQKFTDDISEQDKAAIIEKFSIPEAVEEGEQTYYTFKINGAYYVKQQNGDFKLYDQIMVYIPNGNWANMYFDYADGASHFGGNNSDSSNTGHQILVGVEPPGGENPEVGDIWLFVKDENNITFSNLEPSDYVGMYTYQEDSDSNIESWQSAHCVVSTTMPTEDAQVGQFWIRVKDGKFFKVYICTQATEHATTWSEVYPQDETGMDYNFYISASLPITDGDYWIEIDNLNTRNIESLSQYKFNSATNKFEWRLMGNAAGGSVTIGNGLEYDGQGRLQVKLGEGLRFDSNGAIEMAYNPIVNIEHALVYKKET